MARSYKKTPVCKTGSGKARFQKRQAARAARRAARRGEPVDNGQYRKYFDSYDIHDYVSYLPYGRSTQRRISEYKWRKYYRNK